MNGGREVKCRNDSYFSTIKHIVDILVPTTYTQSTYIYIIYILINLICFAICLTDFWFFINYDMTVQWCVIKICFNGLDIIVRKMIDKCCYFSQAILTCKRASARGEWIFEEQYVYQISWSSVLLDITRKLLSWVWLSNLFLKLLMTT